MLFGSGEISLDVKRYRDMKNNIYFHTHINQSLQLFNAAFIYHNLFQKCNIRCIMQNNLKRVAVSEFALSEAAVTEMALSEVALREVAIRYVTVSKVALSR